MKLEIFDVEHGACALLTCDNGNRLMIDCGHNSTTGWTPGKHLQALGVTLLNKLVITNYDEDHVSGLIDLEQRVTIDWLLRNPSVSGDTIRYLKSETGMGRNIDHLASRVGSFIITNNPQPVFPGVSQEAYFNRYPSFDDENNLSLVFVLTINGVTFLFPGDMECAGWLQLLRAEPGLRAAVARADFLVASHHGRDSGICDEMFTVCGCKPCAVVISDDRHQYDTQKTVPYYASKVKGIQYRGAARRVLTTRSDGDISFDFFPPFGTFTC